MTDPVVKTAIVTSAVTGIATAAVPMMDVVANALIPHIVPAIWGLVGAAAAFVFVPREPQPAALIFFQVFLGAAVASGISVSGGALIGIESTSATTIIAIVMGVGAQTFVISIRANIGRWTERVGDRLSGGNKQGRGDSGRGNG